MVKRVFNGFQIIQDLIKLRWVPEIIKSISIGNSRYSEILDSIPHMSHTELNRKLAVLLKKGVLVRTTKDNTINYSLQKFGEELMHIFLHLEDLELKYFE